jgi:hypothetical protein
MKLGSPSGQSGDDSSDLNELDHGFFGALRSENLNH